MRLLTLEILLLPGGFDRQAETCQPDFPGDVVLHSFLHAPCTWQTLCEGYGSCYG